MTDWDIFHAQALQIAQTFLANPRPAVPVDPDPASTVSLHPQLDTVQQLVETLAPGAFGGAYQDQEGVHVGLTGTAGSIIGLLQAALPDVHLVAFSAAHSWAELVATTDEITQAMSSDLSHVILSAGPDVARNVVTVGVTDVNAPAAKALAAKYGDAVSVFKDEPIQLAADPVAPGRGSYRDPIIGGLDIYSRGRGCSSGFDYGPPLRQDPTGLAMEHGVITAGHCLADNMLLQEWGQGGHTFGTYSRHRFLNGSEADAGTITTEPTVLRFRRVSNEVFIAPGAGTMRITQRLARNNGQRGDRVEVSGARSGFGVGSVSTGGPGRSYVFTKGGQIVAIRNVYSADVTTSIVGGDSGAPVFVGSDLKGHAIALGIVLGSQKTNLKHMFYSQIANVEFELGVTTCTGRGSPGC